MLVRVDELILLIEGALTVPLSLLDAAQHPDTRCYDANQRDGCEDDGKVQHCGFSGLERLVMVHGVVPVGPSFRR